MTLAARIVGPLVPPGVLFVAAAVVFACLATRWAAPFLLRLAASALRGAIAVAATLLIFPEYRWSTRSRRREKPPSSFAYTYGDVVGRTTFWINRLLSVVLHAAAEAVKALPPPLVAVLTGVFAAALSLDLITPW
ncbi:hypothetical protein [Saccharothrix yanglingensis]|uniref:Uncharacterized protein n=1 Tax=Saccharothrix yanglingensis TaxID=659496 RepID=A0ABU0XAG3_9PSEU|nr:hypothetical protein [Saccharothrix yanglingensis]MDQ2589136.1 hypothetical protein [Saccharothrix yanglingensis]